VPQEPSVELPPALARVLTDYEAAAAIERPYAGSGGPLSLRAIAFAAEGAVGYIIGGTPRRTAAPIPERPRSRCAGAPTAAG
jgi:hypothetical protein